MAQTMLRPAIFIIVQPPPQKHRSKRTWSARFRSWYSSTITWSNAESSSAKGLLRRYLKASGTSSPISIAL